MRLSLQDSEVLSIRVPKGWIKKLKMFSHEASIQEGETVAYAELVRRSLQEKYPSLKDETINPHTSNSEVTHDK